MWARLLVVSQHRHAFSLDVLSCNEVYLTWFYELDRLKFENSTAGRRSWEFLSSQKHYENSHHYPHAVKVNDPQDSGWSRTLSQIPGTPGVLTIPVGF